MAIGEVLFLLWGIRVCYNVRNAESLYNEAKLISYAIYNIAFVNMLMVAIQWVQLSWSTIHIETQFKAWQCSDDWKMNLFVSRAQKSRYRVEDSGKLVIYGNKFIDAPHVTSFLMPAT